MITRTFCGTVLLAISACAQADICRWTDAAGAVHYGDHAPPNVTAHCERAPPKKTPAPKTGTYQLDPEIAQIAEKIKSAQRELAPYLDAQADAQARFEATLIRARWRKASEGSR